MPSMVSAERVRSRMSACQPCEMSSFRNISNFSAADLRGFARIKSRSILKEICPCSSAPIRGQPNSLNLNIARPGVHPQCWSAAVHFAVDGFVRISDSPLHCHFDWLPYIYRARTGRDIGVKGGILRQPNVHISRSGAHIPRAGLRALGSDVSAAGLAMEATLDAACAEIPRAGMQIHISRSGLFNLHIAAAGSAFHRARDVVRPNVAGASLQADLAIQPA